LDLCKEIERLKNGLPLQSAYSADAATRMTPG